MTLGWKGWDTAGKRRRAVITTTIFTPVASLPDEDSDGRGRWCGEISPLALRPSSGGGDVGCVGAGCVGAGSGAGCCHPLEPLPFCCWLVCVRRALQRRMRWRRAGAVSAAEARGIRHPRVRACSPRNRWPCEDERPCVATTQERRKRGGFRVRVGWHTDGVRGGRKERVLAHPLRPRGAARARDHDDPRALRPAGGVAVTPYSW